MKLFRVNQLPLVLALGVILLIYGCTKKESTNESSVIEVPIGIAVSLTGNFSPYGINQKNGLTMAVNELNTGSYIPGIKFVPYFMDDKSSPDTCLKIFRDLIFDKK